MIGIVGGLGPSAGADLLEKVTNQTMACRDQEHLPVILISVPHRTTNRTDFVLGRDPVNPAEGIIYAIDKLHQIGANVLAIPCNTSHALEIFQIVREHVSSIDTTITLINMVDAVCEHIATHYAGVTKVGVLSTTGTAQSGVYRKALEATGRRLVVLDPGLQEQLNDAIHNECYGIKAQSNPVSGRAVAVVERCIKAVTDNDAEVCVLACTELSLAISDTWGRDIPLLDSNLVLARSLVNAVAPERLKPWPVCSQTEKELLSSSAL